MALNIRIGQTRRLGDRPPSEDDLFIGMHEYLYLAFLTDVTLEGKNRFGAWVHSFEFLHSVLRRMYLLSREQSAYVEIGEGCALVGDIAVSSGVVAENELRVTLCSEEDSPRETAIGTWTFTVAEYLLQLSILATELSGSIRAIGVDVERYIRRYPPPFF